MSEPIRGLSLTQPWASLIDLGAKQWETRSWSTSYRGWIAVHASKSYPRDCRELEGEEPFRSALQRTEPLIHVGKILAVGKLTDCRHTGEVALSLSETEIAFGDYAPGRFAFRIENVRRLRTPIPCRGALGLWAIPDDVLTQIREQLRENNHG